MFCTAAQAWKKYARYDAPFKQRVLARIHAEGLSCAQATAIFEIRNAGLIG